MGNLPVDLTSFIGRKHDVADVKRLLSVARLVTLTGVGGVGKTRLALRTAGELRRAFTDGVWLVELAQVRDAELVVHTVLEALGVHDDTGRGRTVVLTEYLRDRQLMIVLDNCEHLVDAIAGLAHVLLSSAPGLRLLATSRERLGVGGEHLYQVLPLPLPDPEQPLSPGAVLRYPALALFAERATAVDPSFAVTSANQLQVARVCQLLGGIPLAIELAAVRVRALSLEHLVGRLDDRYRALAGKTRGGLPRHQTMQAAVEWSHALCTPSEQLLWARVSVFAGTFDLAAAETVCSGEDLPADDVLEVLVGLVDKSVLSREQHADHARFCLLEPLRQYGRGKLRDLGGEDEMLRRHRDHYLELAERGEREWFGPSQADIFTRTRIDHANLRAALDFSLDSPAGARTGARLASTLWFYWAGCGVLKEGRHWLDRALAANPEPSRERAKALWVSGYVAGLQGDLGAGTAMLEECRAYARDTGDAMAMAYATHRLGCNTLIGDDLHLARTLFEEARAQYSAMDELNSNVLLASIEQAIAAVFLGDLDGAAKLAEDARTVGALHGERWAYAYGVYVLALVDWSRGELDRAIAHAKDVLRIKRTFNDLLGIVLAVELIAWSTAARGEATRAATLLGAVSQIWPSVGYPMFGSQHFGAPHGACEAVVRQALGDRAFGVALQQGAAFGIEETISYALEEPPEAVPDAPVVVEPVPLTRREREVVALIVEGLSNKEIAARLVIAQRTAEGHVERVLQKLGFNSRAQVAAWAARRL
jgi:non-specific serine/threonine protein kinase